MVFQEQAVSLFGDGVYDPASMRLERDRSADMERKRRERTKGRSVHVPKPADLARRLDLEQQPPKWMRHYWPRIFYKPFSADHLERIAAIERVKRTGGKQAIGAPRGDGKSAILKASAILGVVRGDVRFIPLVAANQGMANHRIAEIQEMCKSPEFMADYPEIGAFVTEVGPTRQRASQLLWDGQETGFIWSVGDIAFPQVELPWVRGCGRIVAAGIGVSLRGLTWNLKNGDLVRPDMALVDDPQNLATALSPVEILKILAYLDADVEGLAAVGGTFAMVALLTKIRQNDVASQLLDRSLRPDWNGICNQMIYEEPKDKELLKEYEELVYQCQIAGKTDSNGLCDETVEWWMANRDRIEYGARVCSDHLHFPPRGNPRAVSAIHYAFSKRAVMVRAAFEAEYQNNPPKTSAADVLPITTNAVMTRNNKLPRGTMPDGFPWLTVGVDIGSEWLHAAAVAWNPERDQGHVVDYWKVAVNAPQGDGDIRSRHSTAYKLLAAALPMALVRVKLRPELAPQPAAVPLYEDLKTRAPVWSPYRRADGTAQFPHMTFVDVAYLSDAVHGFCEGQRDHRWMGVKGAPSRNTPKGLRKDQWLSPDSGYWIQTVEVATSSGDSRPRYLLYHNADESKRRVQEGFVVPVESVGSLTLFGDRGREHQEYAEHVCSEMLVEKNPGEFSWVSRGGAAVLENHWLDATGMALAAYRVLLNFKLGWTAPGVSAGVAAAMAEEAELAGYSCIDPDDEDEDDDGEDGEPMPEAESSGDYGNGSGRGFVMAEIPDDDEPDDNDLPFSVDCHHPQPRERIGGGIPVSPKKKPSERQTIRAEYFEL